MFYRRFFLLLFAAVLCCGTAVSCAPAPDAQDGGLRVVSTIFPSYDFVRQIAQGTDLQLSMLLLPGAQVHGFEPTAKNLREIQDCDLFIYTGGEGDAWVQNLLSAGTSGDTLTLLDCVGKLAEEHKEGMEEDEAESDHADWDEHVWTAPPYAAAIVEQITEKLCALDEKNAAAYRANADAYIEKLHDLDARIRSTVQNTARRELIFADRFPARYFTECYGLDYFAAFPGCAADTEASAATLAFLIDRVKADEIPAVFYIEMSNRKVADAVSAATGAAELLFHSCHNLTKDEFSAGATYLSLMEQNLENLKAALG